MPSSSDVFDDSFSAQLSTALNGTLGYHNETLTEPGIIPSTWQKNLTGLLSSAVLTPKISRIKRDEVFTSPDEDTCLVLTVAKTAQSDEPVATWLMASCSQRFGWMCRFPLDATRVPPDNPTSEDDPQGDLTIVHARSVPIAPVTPLPPRYPDKSLTLTTKMTTLAPSMSTAQWRYESFTKPGQGGLKNGLPLPRTVVPPLDFTIPRITPLAPITPIPTITEIPLKVPVTVEKCPETVHEGRTWQGSMVGTFVVMACGNGNWTRTLADDTLRKARHIVEGLAPEQAPLFDVNTAKYSYGFEFWSCVKTMDGPQYLPRSGPVTDLCEQAKILESTRGEDLEERKRKPTTAAPPGTLAEVFANYTGAGALSGKEILSSVSLLQRVMMDELAKTKQAATARTMLDPESQAKATNATDQFVNVVTRSVSNMLLGVHRPGWSELDQSELI